MPLKDTSLQDKEAKPGSKGGPGTISPKDSSPHDQEAKPVSNGHGKRLLDDDVCGDHNELAHHPTSLNPTEHTSYRSSQRNPISDSDKVYNHISQRSVAADMGRTKQKYQVEQLALGNPPVYNPPSEQFLEGNIPIRGRSYNAKTQPLPDPDSRGERSEGRTTLGSQGEKGSAYYAAANAGIEDGSQVFGSG